MNFIRLGENTVLNLDSVASVSWEGSGQKLVAVVKYLVPFSKGRSGQGQLAYERFTGDAAHALQQLLEREGSSVGIQDADKSSSVTAPVTSGARNPMPPEPLEMLVSGLAKKKAWYYVEVNDRGFFFAMVNMKGSCSMRTFDAETGRFLGKQYARGSYQEQFARFLNGAKEITVDRQPNLENECKEQLPEGVLSYLKGQLPVEP
jgi:hypothetical protein